MTNSLSIVIVNWNSGNQLRECLASIGASADHLPPGCALQQVVVVDNGSHDGSDRHLSLQCGRLVLISNAVNRGFAAACNQGAAGLESDLILFLNPDTRLFDDSLAAPVRLLRREGHARTGIVGIAMVDDTGRIAPSCARFPRAWHFACQALGLDRLWPRTGHYMREWDHGQTRQVDQVIGAFFMIRRELFESLSGFDQRFFVYFEEVDLAWSARRAGWASVHLAEARAYHKGGGTSSSVKDVRLFYSLRSRLQYGHKHFRLPERLLLWVVTFALEPVSRVAHLAIVGRWSEIRNVAAAYALLWRQRSGPSQPAFASAPANSDEGRQLP
jgi:GT2 family glycosyltransferase